MLNRVLVGSTGLVGQNLLEATDFDLAVHSTNVYKAFGLSCEMVVYAGVPGTKYLANNEPERDLAIVEAARENLRKINADKVVLISTVDVYGDSRGKKEKDAPGGAGLTSYGANRLKLEEWVREDFPDATIIRLPAIYGKGLKKNFVFDMMHPAPSMLSADKYSELASVAEEVRNGYGDAGNGFYRLRESSNTDSLNKFFESNDFNSLSFTDSRSEYQFYDLRRLCGDIQVACNEGLSLLNVSVPPLSAKKAYKHIFDKDWDNVTEGFVVEYDMRSDYSRYWGRGDGYLMPVDEELADLKDFVYGMCVERVCLQPIGLC